MATVKPFAAWRYDPALPIDQLVCQPYDVINPSQQEQYYQRHPYNMIRLELPKKDREDIYSGAAAVFQDWQKQGVLRRDDRPAFYLYSQEFTEGGQRICRTGFLARLKAEGYASGQVAPHEETLPGHKQDRFLMMQATYANFSPIFGLYAQPGREIDKALVEAAAGRTEIDFTDEYQVRHRLQPITQPQVLRQVEEQLAGLKIYIADGHHRYETASRFAREIAPGQENAAYVMIHLVNLYDPGLIVLPTHRMVRNVAGFRGEALLSQLRNGPLHLEELSGQDKESGLRRLEEVMAAAGARETVFGLYLDGAYYALRMDKTDPALSRAAAGHSAAYSQLDVTVVHKMVLEYCCGIGDAEAASGQYLSYSRNTEETIAAVDSGEYQFALLLNATKVEELLAVADAGDKMPQKSTFFYPKVIAGLTINDLK
ncbi:MAG: DUF1015 domain-containing protein [Firmicutes bacterium]|nr:DUF1015 domain-containing protein [Bacillota bacterium]